MHVEEFIALLGEKSDQEFVQQHIIDAPCSQICDDEHFRLRTEVARKFGINVREVVVVGSAKLGFSISPKKRYNEFSGKSDVDLAIISSLLFDDFWLDAFSYSEGGAYWEKKDQFFRRLADGWIRPDLMPRDAAYERRGDWWEFFSPLRANTTQGPVRVRAGLFKSLPFLEAYQARAVALCRKEEQ